MSRWQVPGRFFVVALFVLMGWTSAVRADVRGVVYASDGVTPIGGAIVTLQATSIRTVTAADGSFTLAAPDGPGRVIVAAKKGYYNAAATVTAPASGVTLLLEAVPQADNPDYSLVDPTMCSICHPNQYSDWFGSPMSNAGINTWVHDIYSGTGTPGGMGGFVYVRDSVFADTNPNSECASCHQPETWIADPFTRMEGPQDPTYPSAATLHGVSCEVCHKIADIDITHVNFPGIFPGVVTFTRPDGPPYQQVEYGVLGDTSFSSPSIMRPSYQPQLVAELCAACHQDASDPDEDHSYTGPISEPTYLEWEASSYADPQSPYFATCVDCHMPPSGQQFVCDPSFNPPARDPNTVRSHRILGTTPEFLENAVELTVQTQVTGSRLDVHVEVFNAHTGHHVPTGVTIRNMILLVEAWPAGGDPLADALTLLSGPTVHALGGVGDPAQGYYAGLPGRFYAKVNHDASGQGPTFFTDAVGILFDNRIPALDTDVSDYSFLLPPGSGDVQVRVRLIYRRSFRFLVDAKQWTQDGHGQPLEDVQPPHFGHLMESSETTVPYSHNCAGDLDGDFQIGLTDLARMLSHFGTSGRYADGDLDGDGDVDLSDLSALLGVFGTSCD